MIPALRAPSLFGRSGLPKIDAKHAAFPDLFSVADGVSTPKIALAGPDLDFRTVMQAGRISQYVRSGPSHPGAFQPVCSLRLGDKIFLGGRIIDGGDPSRAALFVADRRSPRRWDQLITGIEGEKGIGNFYRTIVGIAANQDHLVALSSTGEVAVSDDEGESWSAHGNVGFTGTSTLNLATCLAASPAGFVAGGINGQLRTASDPRGAWPSRLSQFGTTNINAIVAGPVFALVGFNRIATAPLNNLTTYTSRTEPSSTTLNRVVTSGSIFFAAGSNNSWLRSDGGVTWTQPTSKPWGDTPAAFRTAYKVGAVWFAHFGNGRMATSDDDGATWDELEENGLLPVSHPVAAYLGAV